MPFRPRAVESCISSARILMDVEKIFSLRKISRFCEGSPFAFFCRVIQVIETENPQVVAVTKLAGIFMLWELMMCGKYVGFDTWLHGAFPQVALNNAALRISRGNYARFDGIRQRRTNQNIKKCTEVHFCVLLIIFY